MQAPDITRTPTLYIVPYAHLDTQWRWDFQRTIGEYLPNTMKVNFDYIEKYPHYVFNWTGANRYRLMKEYYPADYARVKKYVAQGRWFPAGSSIEEGDVNLPGPEGIFRQILYGNEYFDTEFGKSSNELMLPDCFGFPASLPSILAHAGLKGFSTQKLSAIWQPAPLVGGPDSPEQTPVGIPFNVGMWVGPDGKGILSSLNPGSYTSNVFTDLTLDTDPPPGPATRNTEVNWFKRINLDGTISGVFADYHYIGTGDNGGATRESTAKLLEAIVTRGEAVLPITPEAKAAGKAESTNIVKVGTGPVHVIEATANQMFDDISPAMTERMPTYSGDLELISHTAGGLTSEAYHKRWIIKNELLADAAEKSSVAANWLGARPYPLKRLNDAWMLELAGHFHDIGAGTGTPRAYQFAWNDDLIAMNQFAGVLTDATEAVAAAMDTQVRGVPVLVYNPLNVAREDVVEAELQWAGPIPKAIQVLDPLGKAVPSQIRNGKILFLANAPSVGYVVYDVLPAISAGKNDSLQVTSSSLENERYRVHVDPAGDVSSIFDKSLSQELLSSPLRLAISDDVPSSYPAWNMDFSQEQAAPRAYVGGPATIRVTDRGAARVSIEVTRKTEGSTFIQTVSLSAGDAGNRVDFSNSIDWKTTSANLRATFPLAASNPNATYNWEIGTIERPNAQPRQFEVGSHRWIDLADKSGRFGSMILTDVKNASDKPSDSMIRLTLIRSPGTKFGPNGGSQGFTDQATQDWGHHDIVFGLVGHSGDWRQGQSDWQAYRLNDPPIAFQATRHNGSLGKSFSLLQVSNSRVRLLALKKSEKTSEVVLRMVELDGKQAPEVSVAFAGPIESAREVDTQERPLGSATVRDGRLITTFTAYQPHTFAIKLAPPAVSIAPVLSRPVTLRYNVSTASNDDTASQGGGFDLKGGALPAELLPRTIQFAGVDFDLASAATGVPNAVTPKGQRIDLPPGAHSRVYILASAIGDQRASFGAGGKKTDVTIQGWGGFVGQWDTRIWKPEPEGTQDWAISASHTSSTSAFEHRPPQGINTRYAPRYPEDFLGVERGYIKPSDLAWYASHQHDANGMNLPYRYSYIFAYSFDVDSKQRTLILPDNPNIRIFAISTADTSPRLRAVHPLYDTVP